MNITLIGIKKALGILLLGLVMTNCYADPLPVGKISFAKGSNAAQLPGATARIIGQDAEIFQGDNIQTAERSFVIITFNDGAKITVRPNSSFTVDHYDAKSANPKAQLSLHEGGVQASSGEIAKQSPDSFQIKTPLATVNAQQAEYSIRLCEQDCGKEDKAGQNAPVKNDPSVVARVVDIRGQVVAKNQQEKNAKERLLALGAPLYSADRLISQKDSYALMVFRDGEKITLQPNSEMAIADYSYQKPGEKDHALYRLTIGGMRALTGSIGKTNKAAYAIDTPVGTIGIRGTGFDLTCLGSCVTPHSPPPAAIKQGLAEGLYSHVWQGQIVLKNENGEQVITMPESGYIANRHADVFQLPEIPNLIPDGFVPRPDKDNSSLDKLFGKLHQKGVSAGLYVAVHQGHLQLKHANPGAHNLDKVDLGKDEAAYVDPHKTITRLAQQGFQQHETYPSSSSDTDGLSINSIWPDQEDPNDEKVDCESGN
jgi:hypothetical protein